MAKNDKIKEKNKKRYFKDFKAELKKVIWPTPKQLLNSTIAVLTIVIITAVIVFALDVVFDLFNKYVITALQTKVETTYNESNETDTNQTSENQENSEGNSSVNETSEANEVEATNENDISQNTENNVE